MSEGPRRRRANAWAWVYATLFDPDGRSDADAEDCGEDSTNSTLSRDQPDDR
ncbi:hypothetical protein ACOJIV_24130 [Haloarcula sp. AONF1]